MNKSKFIQQFFYFFTLVTFLLKHIGSMLEKGIAVCTIMDWMILVFWLMFNAFLLGLYVGRKFQ